MTNAFVVRHVLNLAEGLNSPPRGDETKMAGETASYHYYELHSWVPEGHGYTIVWKKIFGSYGKRLLESKLRRSEARLETDAY